MFCEGRQWHVCYPLAYREHTSSGARLEACPAVSSWDSDENTNAELNHSIHNINMPGMITYNLITVTPRNVSNRFWIKLSYMTTHAGWTHPQPQPHLLTVASFQQKARYGKRQWGAYSTPWGKKSRISCAIVNFGELFQSYSLIWH